MQALQSGNNTAVQFLVTDSVNRTQTKKRGKKCDSAVGSVVLGPLSATSPFLISLVYTGWQYVESIFSWVLKSSFFYFDEKMTVVSCGRAKLIHWELLCYSKKKEVMENFSSLEYPRRIVY